MAIINHPLAAQELGSFIHHNVENAAPEGEPKNWVCFFCYENGIVRQESISNSRVFKYDTFMDTEDKKWIIFKGEVVNFLDSI